MALRLGADVSGDQLSIRLALLGAAISFGTAAMSAAGLNGPWLIYGLSVTAGAAFLAALFWPVLVRRSAGVARLASAVDRAIGGGFLGWVVAVCAFSPAFYFLAHLARQQAAAITSKPDTAAAPAPKPAPRPKSLRDLFETDIPTGLRVRQQYFLQAKSGEEVELTVQRTLNYDSNTKFISVYIPETPIILSVCRHIAIHHEYYLNPSTGLVEAQRRSPGDTEAAAASRLTPSKVVYLYSETDIDLKDKADLDAFYKSKGLTMQFRSLDYQTIYGRPRSD